MYNIILQPFHDTWHVLLCHGYLTFCADILYQLYQFFLRNHNFWVFLQLFVSIKSLLSPSAYTMRFQKRICLLYVRISLT